MATNHDQALTRGLLFSLADRAIAWLLSIPPERCSYTTKPVRIPVSDGLARIELAADLYQPVFSDGRKPLGTVLFRCPYGRNIPIGFMPRAYAARGYCSLVVSSRGTFGSGGEFDPFRNEVADGKAVVEWMRQQDWYTGTFATCGGSYLGYVQWALLMDPPKDLVAAVPSVSPHDFARACWDTGAMDIDIIKWSDNIAHQEEPFSVWSFLSSARAQKLNATINSVPLAQNVEEHHTGKAAWLDRILAKSDITDPHYSPMRLGEALKRTQIPILIITGWYDLFIQQSIEQYMELKERGCNVSLTVGPWNHMKGSFAPKTNQHGLDWIDEHLGKSQEAKRKAPVQYFLTGAEEWRYAAIYPVPTIPCIFYLHGDGHLNNDASANDTAPSTFTYDPQNPTPNIGGNGLLSGGRADDTALAKRDDVLTFDSTILEGDVEICGTTTVELANSTSTPFADVFVRVSEVDAQGKSKNVTETFRRLDPKRDQNKSLKLTLNHCSHRFLKGNKIRVMIAGGNFPQYTRNQGVENSDNRASEMRSVEHTVYHDKLRVSKVVFPLVSESFS